LSLCLCRVLDWDFLLFLVGLFPRSLVGKVGLRGGEGGAFLKKLFSPAFVKEPPPLCFAEKKSGGAFFLVKFIASGVSFLQSRISMDNLVL